MSDARIGGDVSSQNHALLFAFGTAVGTLLRAGVWLLPEGVVDVVRDRL